MLKNVFFLFILTASISFSAELNVDLSAKNNVKFVSEATLESFEGTTENIDGYLLWSGDDFTNESEFYFEVDLATLDTGMGLRNRHMRENYLETDQFPFAEFSGKIIDVKKISNQEYKIGTKGIFKIHGKQTEMEISGHVIIQDEKYNVKSNFEINLNDYNIKIPKLMFMKINELIKIELNFNLKKTKDD